MPHFKDTNNRVHFIESWAHIGLLPDGVVEIDKTEAETLAKATPPPIVPLRLQAAQEMEECKDLIFDMILDNKPVSPAMKAHFQEVRAIANGIDSTSISLPKRPKLV